MRSKLLKQINNIHVHKLTNKEIATCFEIITHLSKEYTHGSILAQKVGITEVELREHITLLRRHMVTKFQNPTGKFYITANQCGYKLTDNNIEHAKYLNTLVIRQKSISLQILELRLAMLNASSKKGSK